MSRRGRINGTPIAPLFVRTMNAPQIGLGLERIPEFASSRSKVAASSPRPPRGMSPMKPPPPVILGSNSTRAAVSVSLRLP